jgi:hypothetical protein
MILVLQAAAWAGSGLALGAVIGGSAVGLLLAAVRIAPSREREVLSQTWKAEFIELVRRDSEFSAVWFAMGVVYAALVIRRDARREDGDWGRGSTGPPKASATGRVTPWR